MDSLRGSIPAYAGQTLYPGLHHPGYEVDPRVRGADEMISTLSAANKGRSPRTRGRHQKIELAEIDRGSIPAYAGQTILDESAI